MSSQTVESSAPLERKRAGVLVDALAYGAIAAYAVVLYSGLAYLLYVLVSSYVAARG